MSELLYYSVIHLGRHPSELDLSLSEVYDLIWAGRKHDEFADKRLEVTLKAIVGRPTL